MPWIGFFVKISRADVFVVLDHTINNVKDSSWFRRVRMLIAGQPKWISIPLEKPRSGTFQALNEMHISNNQQARVLYKKYIRSFEQSYARAPFYSQFRDLFLDYFVFEDNRLVSKNMSFIKEVMSIFNIKTNVIYSSEMHASGSSTQMLVNIVKAAGGNVYLCGDGADAYQDDNLFHNAGISIVRNEYSAKQYNQTGSKKFVSGLSIMDILLNEGIEGTSKMIESYGPIHYASSKRKE